MTSFRHSAMFIAASLLCGGLMAGPGRAGQVGFGAFGGTFTVPVLSLKEAQFHTVVRQERDYSCGSAALATLLTYHYGHPIAEDVVFRAMFAVGDRAAIQKSGFSLADMQKYLATLGYHSDGYRVSLDRLAAAGVPAITLINSKGYHHFVVIKGIKEGDVLVGDPAAGLRVIPRREFEAGWVGISFVIHDDLATGRRHFNQAQDWMVRRKAPLSVALDRQGLATVTTMLPSIFVF